MGAPDSSNNPTKRTPQEMQNQGFDETFGMPTVELVGYDSTNNVIRRVAVDSSGRLATVSPKIPSSIPRGNLANALDTLGLLPVAAWSPREAYSDSSRLTPCVDGDPIYQYRDIAGGGFNAVQATAANRPKFLANAWNGLPGADFSGNTSMSLTATALFAATGFSAGYTVYYVSPKGKSGSNNSMIFSMTSNTDYLSMIDSGLQSKTNGSFLNFAHDGGTVYPEGDLPGVGGVSWDGTTLTQFMNGAFVSSARSGTPPTSGDFMIGNLIGNTLSFQGVLCEILVFTGAHTQVQRDAIQSALASDYALRPTILAVGDSQTAAQGLSSLDAGFNASAVKILGGTSSTMFLKNIGVSGHTAIDCITDAGTPSSNVQYVNTTAKGVVNIAMIQVGENDIQFSSGYASGNVSLYYTQLKALTALYRSANCIVGIATIPPRSNPAFSQYETDRTAINTELRTNLSVYGDFLADIAADSRIGQGTSTTSVYYQSDNTHWTEKGHAIVAQIWAQAMSKLKDRSGNLMFNTGAPIVTITGTAPIAVTAGAVSVGVNSTLTAAATLGINLANANTWTTLQTLGAGAVIGGTQATNVVPLIVRQVDSTTVNPFELQSLGGTKIYFVGNDGKMVFGTQANVSILPSGVSGGSAGLVFDIYDDGDAIHVFQIYGDGKTLITDQNNNSLFAVIALTGLSGFGTASPTAAVDIKASTTSAASLRLRSGTAPTSPNNGDIWYDGSHLQGRVNGTTAQLDNTNAPVIQGSGRQTGQTAADASVTTYTLPAADHSFIVSANVNVTAFTAGAINATVTYTDETNTSRTETLNFSALGGTIGIAIGAAGAFSGVPSHIRCKASTTITVATTVPISFTGTYNVEGVITQVI